MVNECVCGGLGQPKDFILPIWKVKRQHTPLRGHCFFLDAPTKIVERRTQDTTKIPLFRKTSSSHPQHYSSSTTPPHQINICNSPSTPYHPPPPLHSGDQIPILSGQSRPIPLDGTPCRYVVMHPGARMGQFCTWGSRTCFGWSERTACSITMRCWLLKRKGMLSYPEALQLPLRCFWSLENYIDWRTSPLVPAMNCRSHWTFRNGSTILQLKNGRRNGR